MTKAEELLEEAQDMPYGAAKTLLVEEAVRTADAAGEADVAFEARIELIEAYQFGAEPGKSFVPFSWCLAAHDAEPDRYADHLHSLLWDFKWMVGNLTDFPEIPLDRTYAVLDDMERRWREGGHSLHAVHRYRELVAAHVGDVETELEQFRLWCAAPRDELSNCVGCDPTGKIEHLNRHRRYEESVDLAGPVLQGRMTCREQPRQILTALLKPYVHTGRYAEAADAHRRAYRSLREDRGELEPIASHIEFCALTGNEVRALEMVERHLSWLEDAPSPHAEMSFAAAAALALRRMDPDLPVRRRGRPEAPAGALADELAGRAADIAVRFDARNGTSKQSTLVANSLAQQPWAEFVPLSDTARRVAQRAAQGRSEAFAAKSAPPPTVDPALVGDALLDQAERWWVDDERERARAGWAAFAERVPEAQRTPAQRARLVEADGLLAVERDPQQALAAWREALAAYAALGETTRVLRVRARLGLLLCQLGEVAEGVATGEEPLRALVAADDRGGRTPWGVMLGLMLAGTGREAEAEREVRRVLDADDLEERHRVYAAYTLADLLVRRDDTDAAVALFTRVVDHGTGPMAVDARFRRGRLLSQSERAEEAVIDLVESVAEFTARSATEQAAVARVDLAIAYLNTGRLSEAAEAAEEAIAGLAGSAAAELLPQARHVLATVYRELGELDPALELIRTTIAGAAADLSADGLARLREEEGDLLERLDRDGEAVGPYQAAADGYDAADAAVDRVRALRKAARSARFAERPADAARLLAGAEAALLPLPSAEPDVAFHSAGLDYDRAILAQDAGRVDEAVQLLHRAAEAYEALGADDNAADARLTMAMLLDAPRAEPELRRVFDAVEPGGNLWYRAGYALADALRDLNREPEAIALEATLDSA
jgi:tetratricopeptide (TPR) repeat protein